MADERRILHLTLQAALPLEENPENQNRDNLWKRPRLTRHKAMLLKRIIEVVHKAATSCLRRFEPHQEALWWQPTDNEGKVLRDKDGKPTKRISGQLQVVIKLRQVAPLGEFALPAAIKDGIHAKIADLLRSYAQRKLDPQFAEKTSYPHIEGSFPIVWQMGFRFLEHGTTKKVFVYLPLFPRGGHDEHLNLQFDRKDGPMLQEMGGNEIETLSRARSGILLPLQFDKWGEATFMRDAQHSPRWKATHRRYDQRWMQELQRSKEFKPKRLELFMRRNRLVVNITCEIRCRPPVQTENFMGVALGLHDLINVAVIDTEGRLIHERRATAEEYDRTVFNELARLQTERGGEFFERLETFHYKQVAQLVREAVQQKAFVAVELVGNIPKGKYSPRINRRLSFWPFGKLADFLSYKAVLAGLPKPYGVYSATVRFLCSSCGAANRNGDQQIALEGVLYYCGNCNIKGNSGSNAALNLARRARELSLKGVVAR